MAVEVAMNIDGVIENSEAMCLADSLILIFLVARLTWGKPRVEGSTSFSLWLSIKNNTTFLLMQATFRKESEKRKTYSSKFVVMLVINYSLLAAGMWAAKTAWHFSALAANKLSFFETQYCYSPMQYCASKNESLFVTIIEYGLPQFYCQSGKVRFSSSKLVSSL